MICSEPPDFSRDGYMPLPTDDPSSSSTDTITKTSNLFPIPHTPDPDTKPNLAKRAFRLVRLRFDNHADRVRHIHRGWRKYAALLVTVGKVAYVAIPLLFVDQTAGWTYIGINAAVMVACPFILKGIQKGIETYGKKKKKLEGDELKEFMIKHMRRLNYVLQGIGWIANPLGNLAGAILLKSFHSLEMVAERKMREGTKRKKVVCGACQFFEFVGFHAGRIVVPMLIDTPLSLLMKEISKAADQDETSTDENLINGQDIRDKTFNELFQKYAHNSGHSQQSPYSNANGTLLSQFSANQQLSPLDQITSGGATSVEMDIGLGPDGEIWLIHNIDQDHTIYFGHAEPYFEQLAQLVSGSSGRMIHILLDNFNVPKGDVTALMNQTGISDLVVSNHDALGSSALPIGDIYDAGGRIFLHLDTAGRGYSSIPWQEQWTSDHVFDGVKSVFDHSHGGMVKADFVTAPGLINPNTQELINAHAVDFIKMQLAAHPDITGGDFKFDMINHGTAEVDALFKLLNETPVEDRAELIASWNVMSPEQFDESLLAGAWEKVAEQLFMSFTSGRGMAANPLGDLGDHSRQLGSPKK